MEIDEDHVQYLLSMGFPSELDVRKALRAAKNDVNDAVAILTNDHPVTSFDTLDDIDIEMKDIHPKNPQGPVYGPSLPPSYDEVVESEQKVDEVMLENSGEGEGHGEEENPYEFPVTNLYELEGRVFAEHWSIPYKREESLGKCLIAATRLAEAGLSDGDENCTRFVDRCMHEAFQKLMTASAVHKWNTEIQEGIFSMLQLLIDLVVARLQHLPVHIILMDVLAMAFSPETEYHYKNKAREDRTAWEDKFEGGQPFAVGPTSIYNKHPHGWLTHLINRFAIKGGFDHLKKTLESDDLDAPSIAALLRPFGTCAEFLNPDLVRGMLSQGMEKSIKFVQNLEEKDFKEKKVGSVSDLLASMKLLCIHMWTTDIKALDDLRLDVALRMLKSPHFNAKMNSLKEVTKLIEDATSSKFPRVKTAIVSEKILDWMVKNKVLSIALEGNIDQAQYCDKIKGIVDFLGTELSLDELSMIWKLQNGQTNNVIENIHSIIAAAAVKFDPNQLEHLVLLIQKKWQEDNDKMREKLLSLIGKIGRDSKVAKTTSQWQLETTKSLVEVLNLLWDLAHLPVLSTDLIEQALDEHLGILNDSYAVKDQVKRQYVSKCVEDIKKGACVLPTLKQLHQLSKNILKHSFKQDKGILHDLNKNCDIIKLVTQSLVKCHKQAVTVVGEAGTFGPDTLVDTRYPHSEYVNHHLSFLQYVLQEGVLYLPWNRAKEIWSTLVASTEACEWDTETCYEWFSSGIMDLDNETQSQLFLKELLRLDPAKLSEKGFQCFKTYFENVNRNDHRLKKDANGQMVAEKSELLGLDFLWELCLNTQDESIANNAIQLLLSMSYTSLASRLKKDPLSLHKKFITECKTRLEAAMLGVVGTVVARAISSATKTLTAFIVPEVANIPPPTKSQKQLNIERLLWIADQYVLSVEETHTSPRTILPHGASFQGYQINLFVTSETPKQEFMLLCHSNETLGGVRVKISYRLRQTPENIQIVAHEKLLGPSKDQKLLHQLDFEDNQMVQVRLVSSSTSSTPSKEPMSTPSSKQTFDLEQEKTLPGVVMAAGGEVFDMLYQLADLEEPKITTRVRKLLMLIPTDPAISEALDSITSRGLKHSSSTDDLSPRASPRKIASTPSPLQSPQEVLSTLFDASAPDMSAFRVLYNMEVLSSKLVPTSQDTVTRSSAQTFFEEFLNAGGLSVVVNLLQPEALLQDTIYEIRQGCYSICLQLARFLLCGQTVTGDVTYTPSITEEPKTPLSASAPAAGATPHSVPSISITDSWAAENRKAGRHAVETMGVHDFTETVSCFMRVAWAAAAGKLHLLSFAQTVRENTTVYSRGKRSRQSSTGSTGSTGSESDTQSLHGGVCVQQQVISTKDCNIAKEALEILVTCLQLRSELIATFYSLPCVSDFIIDILVGCSQADIRNAALDQFYLLSQTEVSQMEGAGTHQQNPHQFLLQVLLKAYLPFWVSSTSTRGASQRLLNQCSQYFDLRCKLLEKLSVIDQRHLQVDVHSMLEDEINWLTNFVPSTHQELKETDNCLLAGHLKLIRTLFTCENVNKEEFGKMLVYDLLHDFLFPASKLMMDSLNGGNLDNLSEFNPKCNSSESRVAAYELLTELAYGSLTNLSDICKQLLQMHHLPNPDSANEWEYLPPVDGRASCGYVGLKNGGATCYMNSVIQQLYMMPNIPESILCTDEEENNDEEQVFYQLQTIFGHLMDSHLQYYEPEKFWRVFQLWGQTVNIREQQDAFDFFQALVDQMDEHIKHKGKEEIFKKMFQGIFSDQKICKECPHRYEREEAFLALNLTVKNATLQDSLDQFVKGELLEGDNAYYCEKCEEKRNTIKRMCIKTLPPHLCIQLKRFGYDWEANRALKFDDYFKVQEKCAFFSPQHLSRHLLMSTIFLQARGCRHKQFPWILDMEPYTAEGMTLRESANMNGTMEQDLSSEDEQATGVRGDAGAAGDSRPPDIVISSYLDHKPINYELVGVVVHSGQANAGHYYSFIKDRRGTVLNNPNKGKWFRFNDTIVEEFEMNDTNLESECFGGTYKAKVYDQSNSYPEDRQRYWNGYMLFYEIMEESKTPLSAKKSKLITKKLPANGRSRLDSDSLMELTELVHKGERRGIFMEKMPASIQRLIHAENLTFVKNRDVYNQEYFKFVKNHVARNSNQVNCPQYSEMSVWSVQLGVKFLFNTYFRTKIKTRPELDEWVEVIETLLTQCKEVCLWFLEYLASEEGSGFTRPFLLDCPNRDVRLTMAKILERLFCCFLTTHSGLPTHKCLDTIMENLLLLLNKEVIDQCKQSIQYFLVLKSYVQLGTKACIHMFKLNGFKRLAVFLLGNFTRDQEANIRRWSSIQSRDFANLHTTLATLILNCDVSSFRTEDVGSYPVKKPQMVIPQTYLKMSADMENYVFGAESVRYVREVVHAIRETGNPLSSICDMLLYCSFCNEAFSTTLIKQLMLQYMNAPSNELKPIFSILTDLLTLEDSLQLKRLQLIIDGHVDDNGQQFEGLLAVVRLNHVQDSKRSYGCIKFLVNLANKCPVVKDYLQQTKSKWQWAVNWLKKKMSEYSYWSSSTATTLSNEDSNRKSFQRTVSAQDTLAEATAILSELEAVNAEMDTNSNPDSGSERVEENPEGQRQGEEEGQGQDSSPGPQGDGQRTQEERDQQKMENS